MPAFTRSPHIDPKLPEKETARDLDDQLYENEMKSMNMGNSHSTMSFSPGMVETGARHTADEIYNPTTTTDGVQKDLDKEGLRIDPEDLVLDLDFEDEHDR